GCGPSIETATHQPRAPSPVDTAPPANAKPSVTPPTVPAACAKGATPIVRAFTAPSVILGDVTGDGIDDWMEVEYATIGSAAPFKIFAGPWPGTEWATYVPHSGVPTVVTADVNQDGALDLAIAEPFSSRIDVYFGPLAKGAALRSLE